MEKKQQPPIDSKEHLFGVKKMEHKPLETDEGKQLAAQYASIIHKHLIELTDTDSKLLAMAYGLLNRTDSYDKSQPKENLKEGMKQAIGLLEKTSDRAYVKLISLGDLLNESKIFLYPNSRLKPKVRHHLEELCSISLGMYEVSGHYVNTNVCSVFLAWGIDPMEGRDHINFTPATKKK